MEIVMADTEAPTRTRRSTGSSATRSSTKSGNGSSTRAKRSGGAKTGVFEGTGAVIGAAAAGLAVGLAANVARKFAVQAPTLIAGDWDKALAAEHQLTLKVFDALEATTDRNTVKRATLLMNLKHMLAKHDMEEANVIYPAMRETGEREAADHLNSEHGYVKQYLFELSEMPKDSPMFLPKLRAFRADIEKHMQEEETKLFPALKSRLSDERNKQLTSEMNKEGLKLA
jgi:hemerythrin-like domain-containing protein